MNKKTERTSEKFEKNARKTETEHKYKDKNTQRNI